jgi:hypothetical protein
MLRQLGFYLDMLEILERANMPKPGWRPPLLHAAAMGSGHPEAAALVARITDVFYRSRYGRGVAAGELGEAKALVSRLSQVLSPESSGSASCLPDESSLGLGPRSGLRGHPGRESDPSDRTSS